MAAKPGFARWKVRVSTDDRRYLRAARARFRIGQDIYRARAGDSADRNVRSRLRQLDSPASDLLRMARERGVVRCPRMLFTPMALMMSSI
jgi:hypothetical protein